MTTLYIANCTQHDHTFSYRLVEERGVKTQMIRSGSQIAVAKDLTTPQINGIIEHDRKYGLCSIAEFERRKEFVPRIYSIDRQIPADVIQRCMDLNTGVLTTRGEKARQLAALAVNNAIESGLRESPANTTLDKLEMSVVEDKAGAVVDDGGPISAAPPVAEGHRVVRLPQGETPTPARGRGRPRRAA